LLAGRRSHLVQRRDCPGVSAGDSACYTAPACFRQGPCICFSNCC